MNNNELAIKFSNDKYCTKKDVIDTLKTPLIDSIWKSVLEYRSAFSVVLPLKHINNSSYFVCLTPNMVERLSSVTRKLTRLSSTYDRMVGLAEKQYFKNSSYVKILKCVGLRYGLKLEDFVIDNIVNGNISTLSPELMILYRYHQCLLDIEKNPMDKVNNEILGRFYSYLIGSTELPSIFRTKEIQNNRSKVIVGKVYLGVPVNTIESNMEQLYSFLNSSQISMFIKAISAFYFIYYVKPFDEFTEEIATLVMKKVIAMNDIGSISAMIDLEDVVANKEELENVLIESQRTLDLTYLVDYILTKFESILSYTDESLFNSQKLAIHKEINQSEEENILNKTPSTNISDEDSFKNVSSNNVDVPAYTIKKTYDNDSSSSSIGYNRSIAISNLPTGLSEDEANRLENHLLELNPNLSRGQAYFYARHCTLGMNYTISQYKKELGCAYETARSSMDHLVYLGYYRKELLKNKYIYTPIKKG